MDSYADSLQQNAPRRTKGWKGWVEVLDDPDTPSQGVYRPGLDNKNIIDGKRRSIQPPRFIHGERENENFPAPIKQTKGKTKNKKRTSRHLEKRLKLMVAEVPTENTSIRLRDTLSDSVTVQEDNYSDDSPLTDIESDFSEMSIDNDSTVIISRQQQPSPHDTESDARGKDIKSQPATPEHPLEPLSSLQPEVGQNNDRLMAIQRENKLLKQQIYQLRLYEFEKVASLKKEMRRMEFQNDNLTILNSALSRNSALSHKKKGSGPELSSMIEELVKKDTIVRQLKEQLNQAQALIRDLSILKDDDANLGDTSTIEESFHDLASLMMPQIQYSIHQLAVLLQQYRENYLALEDDDRLRRSKPVDFFAYEHNDLNHLVHESIGNISVFNEASIPSFCAIIFAFLRNRVFESSDIWNDFHFDGLMSREYQRRLASCGSLDLLERFHRTTLRETLRDSKEFKECILPTLVQELRLEIMAFVRPLIGVSSISNNSDTEQKLNKRWEILFNQALDLRARCFPTRGKYYEIVQYKPGDVFDPDMMEAQSEKCTPVQIPHKTNNDSKRRVKLCMHGLIKTFTAATAHEEDHGVSSGIELIRELSQPFRTGGTATEGREEAVITHKAVVLLQEE